VTVGALRKRLRERHVVGLASGQGKLSGKIFRVGHLGLVDVPDIEGVLSALQEELGALVRQPLSARQPA
jgi:alanine-glyoxylate transaminase/serine-glyoxylate transaminase/serine-pyruvate transaminase